METKNRAKIEGALDLDPSRGHEHKAKINHHALLYGWDEEIHKYTRQPVKGAENVSPVTLDAVNQELSQREKVDLN